MSRETNAILDDQLLSREFYQDPYPLYDALREQDPVHWSNGWNGWLLTRHADVSAALRDFERLTNRGRIDLFIEHLPDDGRERMGPLVDHFAQAITHLDPPEHSRIRGLLRKVFTNRLIESMRPRVEALVDELLTGIQDAGEMDIIRDFAYPLPATVLGEMLGVPAEDRDQYKEWSDDIGVGLLGTGRAALENVERARSSLIQLQEYLRPLIAERRQHPRDDLISGLIGSTRRQEDAMTERELTSTCVTLILAGHGTTTNLIGNGLLALMRHPDQRRRLSENPDLMPMAIEELLRYDTPLQRMWRMATQDLEIGGHRIEKGQIVLVALGSANRDPERFPDPSQLDIGRVDNEHVALGAGIHLCIGGPLARLQGSIALRALLTRMPNMEATTDEFEWTQNLFHRGVASLPVAW